MTYSVLWNRADVFCFGMIAVLILAAGTALAAPPAIVPPREELDRPFGPADLEIFKKPPMVYHPETWFHFIGGNVALPGITADLEAIAAAGFSGVQLFHGQFGGPWPGVQPQIPCLSESWDAAVKHTAEECKRLNLRFTMQNCPGWAMSGGPWIEPSQAMRHLVWSRTDLDSDGHEPVRIGLPKPQPSGEDWRDYREIAVLGFPTPHNDTNRPLVPESIRSNREEFPWTKCLAGNAEGKLNLPPASDEAPNWIEVSFPNEVTLRTVEFSSINGFLHAFCYEPGVRVTVEAVLPDEGTRTILRVDLPPGSWQDDRPISLACDETTARTFRLTILNRHPMSLNSLRLLSGARKNNWESEAGWTLRGIVREGEHPRQSPDAFVEFERILDLTDKMNDAGELSGTIPPGKWTLLRIGHVNTGMRNAPAPPEGTGWECDKLSRRGPDAHFAGYIGRLSGKEGPLADGLLGGMLLDSWECKTQTWTPGLEEIFAQKTGYPLRKYLPAVFGYVVKDHETSKRFLRDWRGTIGELFANRFYGRMAELAKQNGLTIQYETAAGDIFPADLLEYHKHADVPMCEFWQPFSEGFVGSLNFKPIKPTASAARMYDKPRVAAEAFTSFALTWDEHWGMLKEVFNVNAVEGVTHCVFHTYTHNPRTDFLPPGTSFGSGIGTPFLRGQTWWKQMPEFTGYLSRCCFLLERGRPVSDVLWYLGDEIDHKPDQEYPFPPGYKYDYCNPDVLLNRLSVRDGRLETPEGIRYRVLWMPNVRRMLPETVEKLRQFVRDGAVIVGDAPEGPATLSGGEETQQRFDAAVRELWGESGPPGVRVLGRGKIVSGMSIDEALKTLSIEPDVLAEPEKGTPFWTHRRIDGADWYFVCAPKGSGFHGTVDFRSHGKTCEIWDPLTGKAEPVSSAARGDRSQVELDLPPAGACFVVFHSENGWTADKTVKRYKPRETVMLTAPWTLSFPEGWGAPESLRIEELTPWNELELSDEGKAFSGTVRYTTTFRLDHVDQNDRYTLDLGNVEMIASVTLNGEHAGACWAAPYRVEVTDAVRDGENVLEIEVTSTWFNRLVYDAGLPESQRKTWTINGPAKENALRKSGLLGPTVLKIDRIEPAKSP